MPISVDLNPYRARLTTRRSGKYGIPSGFIQAARVSSTKAGQAPRHGRILIPPPLAGLPPTVERQPAP